MGLQLLSFCVCGYETQKPVLLPVPQVAAGAACHLLAGAHPHHFSSQGHQAECADHGTHIPELTQVQKKWKGCGFNLIYLLHT